jgi:hypothetical protein
MQNWIIILIKIFIIAENVKINELFNDALVDSLDFF